MGVWFDGYDTTRLANTPRVYLLPAGNDVVRPRGTQGVLRYWQVTEQLLPVPYPIGEADMQDPDWIAGIDGLNGRMFAIKPYTRMRAYPYTPDFEPTELNTDTRSDRPVGVEHAVDPGDPGHDAAGRPGRWASIASSRT